MGLDSVERRALRHGALSDPTRLAMIDELTVADRSPVELRRRFRLESNLLAHHLDVLEAAGFITRSRSSGDGRRRYVHLDRGAFEGLVPCRPVDGRPVLFVCTHNSARSQLAAAMCEQMGHRTATSAGTHPVAHVHPEAVAAARRAGFDLTGSVPTMLGDVPDGVLVVTVCDQAHEELGDQDEWLHWSVPDPVRDGSAAAFDATVDELTERIPTLATPAVAGRAAPHSR